MILPLIAGTGTVFLMVNTILGNALHFCNHLLTRPFKLHAYAPELDDIKSGEWGEIKEGTALHKAYNTMGTETFANFHKEYTAAAGDVS